MQKQTAPIIVILLALPAFVLGRSPKRRRASNATALAFRTPQMTAPNIRRPVDASAVVICTILSFVWAVQQIAIKLAIPDVDSLLQVGLRSLVAAVVLYGLNRCWLQESWIRVRAIDIIKVGGAFAGEFFFLALALRLTMAAHASVLLYTAPLFAAIGISATIAEERLGRRQWAGLAMAFIGIAVAFLYPVLSAGLPHGNLWWLGDLFGLMAGMSWGLCTIALRTTRFAEAPPSQMLFWQLFVGGIVILPAAALLGQTHFEPTATAWTSLAFQTFGVSIASYIVWCTMLRRYLVARLGVLLFLSPLFGVILGVVVLHETLEPCFFVGSVLVLAGLAAVQSGR